MSTSSAPPQRRSRFAFRFSLRILLVAFTAVAIGFPIWYRWPYEEVVVQGPSRDPLSRVKVTRIYTTWQRQWGGSRLKHGPERIVHDGRTSSITTYASGKKTGPYQTFYVSGTLAEEGHYLDGDKDGISKSYDDNGSVKATFKRRQGVLEGPASVSSKCGNHQLQFADGRLVAVDGRAVENRLGALADSDKIESLRAREILAGVQGCAFIGLPLSTTTDTLSRLFNVPFVADEQHVDPKIPVDFCGHDISLASALAAMATLHDLHCDYRYGAIWITSPENGEDWRDPTGISEILPPTESPLAAVWNEPVNSSMAGTPLSAALNQLAASKAVNIDVSQITANRGEAQAYQVQRNFVEHPFRHVLGIFLYEARCRCRLEGETLVILPQN